MMRKLTLSVIALVASAFSQSICSDSVPSCQQLKGYIADLQRSPDDRELREKIIKLALTVSPRPGIPVAMRRFEGAAEFAFKNAKGESDFLEAAKQYEKSLLIAPWLAEDYFNAGVAYEKGQRLQEAIRSFELYLLAKPDAQDAAEVQKRIGGLQFGLEKAADQEAARRARQVELDRRKQEEEVKLQSLEGTWAECNSLASPWFAILRAPNGDLVPKFIKPVGGSSWSREVRGLTVSHFEFSEAGGGGWTLVYNLSLSSDGKKLDASLARYWHGKFQSSLDSFPVCRAE